ncbi:MAG: 3-ketoacyl-ACP reductase [Rhodospirillales bacterium]|nr:3-ketoacyl-ACP reductase [Rhodospirillales bacterium]
MSDNKVALVTGGRRGIGLGIAKTLAGEGYDIAFCGVSDEAEDAATELRDLGVEVLYVKADISSAADRQTLINSVKGRFGRLDVLVNNAGVAPNARDDILEAGEESFERLMRINLQGPYFLTQLAANWMIEQKQADDAFQGTIIFITSFSATVASVSRGEYCISKSGLTMAAKLYAARMAEYGIMVYEVRPGVIATDMTSSVKEKYDKLIAEGLFLQPRWGEPEDIGKAVAMLARGDLAYSTGQVIMVDGGHQIETL